MRAILLFLFFLTALTSSWDLIGVLDVAGGNLRICALFMAMFVAVTMLTMKANGFPRARVFGLLLIWFGFDMACTANAPQVFRTYAYLAWLTLDVIFIYACTAAFRTPRAVDALARIYYYTFVLLALFGILQFVCFPIGLDLLVKQNWVSFLARINGLSYEPSYFATYLIVGWTMSLVLLTRNVHFVRPFFSWSIFVLHTVTLLLCSSRLGYLGMLLMGLVMAPSIVRSLRTSKVSRILASSVVVGFVLLVCAGAVFVMSVDDPTFLLNGTGLGGTAAHSVDSRLNEFEKYEDLFLANPLKGYSLGGIAAQLAGAGESDSVDYDDMRHSQGINVSLEVILGTGVIGAPFFFWYFYKLTFGSLAGVRRSPDLRLRAITEANVWGLLMQFFLLQFNQNILRNYFWIQIAVVSCLVTYSLQTRAAAVPRRPLVRLRKVQVPQGGMEGLALPSA